MQQSHLDLRVEGNLLGIVLLVLIWVHAQVVERKLLLYALLERLSLLQRKRVALRNDWHDINELTQLLEHHNIDRLERMAARLDEEQTAVDSGVLEISLTLGSELLAQVSRVLVLDVLDDGVPAALIVDQVTVAWSVDNVEP